MRKAIRITPSGMFLSGCVAFLLGVFVATHFAVPSVFIWSAGCLGVLLVFAGWPLQASFGSRRYLPVVLGIILFAIAFGVIRTQQTLTTLQQQTLDTLVGEQVALTGTAASFPNTGLERTSFVLETDMGRARITAPRYQAPQKGDRVRVSGVVRIPEPFEDFNYPMFLAKDGITVTMSAQEVETIDVLPPLHPLSVLRATRSMVDVTALRILPYTEGAILKAVLVGDEGSMSNAFKEALNASGLRHIVAVSGMNIAIILSLFTAVAKYLGWSRRRAFWLGFAAVTAFVVLIGAPASAVRAGIMGLLLVAAPLLGRRGSGLRAAVFAAAVMVALSPLTLMYDSGFQLSFLAVLGIILLGPILMRLFARLPHLLAETLAMTFAAQIAVTPLLLTTFGRLSLIAPLSNLIIVPAILIITVWGFLAVALGAAFLSLGKLVALPLLPYFSLVRFVAETFALLPAAEIALSGGAAIAFALAWYGVFLWLVFKTREKRLLPIDALQLL